MTLSLTPEEIFLMYELIGHRMISASPSEADDYRLLSSKLRDALLEILISHQDNTNSKKYQKWSEMTLNKIKDMNEELNETYRRQPEGERFVINRINKKK
jgi:hypothetical protein